MDIFHQSILNAKNIGNVKYGRINLETSEVPTYFIAFKINRYRYKIFFFEKWASLKGIFQNLVKIKGLKLRIGNAYELAI